MRFSATYLYPYRSGSSFGLLALHLLHSKAHIGYLNDLNAAETRTWRSYIDLDQNMTDTIRGMFCRFELASHNIACSDILCTNHPPAWNVLNRKCKIADPHLYQWWVSQSQKNSNHHSTLTVTRFTIVMTFLASKLCFEEALGTLRVTFAGC